MNINVKFIEDGGIISKDCWCLEKPSVAYLQKVTITDHNMELYIWIVVVVCNKAINKPGTILGVSLFITYLKRPKPKKLV